jgi:hypothetical protein
MLGRLIQSVFSGSNLDKIYGKCGKVDFSSDPVFGDKRERERGF